MKYYDLKNKYIKFSEIGDFMSDISGDWGLGIGDWGLGIGPNPQSPIPNPQFCIEKLKNEKFQFF
jgi:hypothetical protein